MKLTELNPRFYGAGGEGITNSKTGDPVPERHGVGLSFDCPCGCGDRVSVGFANPVDGGEQYQSDRASWQRTGEDFETMTLTPSILRVVPDGFDGCRWHGFITNGELIKA